MKLIFIIFGAICALTLVLTLGFYWVARAQLEPLAQPATAHSPAGQFIQLSQGWVHYKLEGKASQKPLVVLVHGFSTPSFVWQGLVPSFLQGGYQVLRYDLYGRGWSARPSVKYDEQLFYIQLKELLSALGFARNRNIVLVGYSMGGAIATHFAAREDIKGVALIAPAGLKVNSDGAGVLALPLIGDWLMAVRGKEIMLTTMKQPENQGRAVPNIVELYEEQMRYEGYLQALLSTLRHFPMAALAGDYKRLGEKSIPTLTIFGKRDSVVPISNLATINKLVPQNKSAIHESATHAITYSEPEFVSRALLKFFNAL